jgi:hydrogenase maturation protease
MGVDERMIPRTLLIGIGNRDRGDDAAGLEVVRRVRRRLPPGVVVLEREGRASDLMEAWLGAEDVVLVDAASGAEPGTVRRFEAHREKLPASVLHASTHSWGVAEAVEMARALGQLPPRVIVYAIFGKAFEVGRHRLSPEAEAAVARASQAVIEELPCPWPHSA